MGILLGLATALCWGSADLLARFATRSIGTFRTMLYMQLTGLVLMTAAMHWLGGWGHLADGSGLRPWMWGILVGVLNASSTLALYRSFEIGKMSVVAPISAGYPALTMVLSAMTGERLTVPRFAGVVLIIVGVIVVARGEEVPGDANPLEQETRAEKTHLGVGWALMSGAGFGFMFWLLGIRVVPLLGSAPSVWLIRLTSVVTTALAILLVRRPMALPGKGAKRWILGVGILDTSAYVLNNFGMQHEQVSVVSVLASLYGAVTVGLAATILGEKISRAQWMGVGAIFAGIVLISR
ncbi:MAG TPA: DMT family transporter [Candidatus Sulfotelmatobacter sp.]|nr:DMT family transporter [Candidatus Sulfotelmatobacter sp.]